MPVVDKATLKSYFNNADNPTYSEYVDLIDSLGTGDMLKSDYDADTDGKVTPEDHNTTHQLTGGDPIKLDDLAAPDNNTDLNVSISKHGLTPKAPDDTSKFLRGDATWAAPVVPKLDDLSAPDDNTDLNVSITTHGLTPRAPNDVTKFLRGDGIWGNQQYWCLVHRSADFTHNSSGSWLFPTFDEEVYDPLNMHSTSVNTERITVPVDGLYIVTFNAVFASNTTGTRSLCILKNAASYQAVLSSPAANILQGFSISTLAWCVATDYLRGGIYQNSGGNLNITHEYDQSTSFRVALLI